MLTAVWVDKRGLAFFDSGRGIVAEALNPFGQALKKGDPAGMERVYAPGFQGTSLGLVTRKVTEDKDGVRRLLQASGNTPQDRAAALAEWRAYREGFASIDDAGLHIDQLEEWGGSHLVATVRFEVIGTPQGAAQPGIDRARFRMGFDRTPQGLQITSASFLEGDRLISDTPQFADVAPAAGVDFTNKYYPAFLNEKMAFGMIRYGPGGISAADVDNDGFYDLFVPDGVESRFFRNRGDGTFEDVTAKSGLSGLDGASVGVFADYDNDGSQGPVCQPDLQAQPVVPQQRRPAPSPT